MARVGVAIADALGAAHRVGILHRDVKPGNVLLGHDGRVKLGDFGIARLLAGQSVTPTDVIAFTPEHVAPEILRGHTDGPWSDLYGLASTLTTALIGAPPFRRRPDERMESLLSRKLMAAPPLLPDWVPGALAELLTRGLDPDPSRRPSLAEFRQQLAAAGDAPSGSQCRTPAMAATTVSATGDTMAGPDDNVRDMPAGPLIGPLRRPRSRRLAIPAFFIALLAATVAVAVVARNRDDGGQRFDARRTRSSSCLRPKCRPLNRPWRRRRRPLWPRRHRRRASNTLITAQEAETFVRAYYDAVAAGNYRNVVVPAGSRSSNVAWRGRTTTTSVSGTTTTSKSATSNSSTADQDQAIVLVELRWNGNTTAETNQFTLRENEAGDLLIASQSTLD